MQENIAIPIPFERLQAFCERHAIRKMALFGSVLREDFGPESDVDVLVEFEPGRSPDLIRFQLMEDALAEIFQHPVDLVTFKSLIPRLRDRVLNSATVIHE
jgi:hypothetical protein